MRCPISTSSTVCAWLTSCFVCSLPLQVRLSKQLTELEKQFYGSSMAYDKAMQQSSEPLEKVSGWGGLAGWVRVVLLTVAVCSPVDWRKRSFLLWQSRQAQKTDACRLALIVGGCRRSTATCT